MLPDCLLLIDASGSMGAHWLALHRLLDDLLRKRPAAAPTAVRALTLRIDERTHLVPPGTAAADVLARMGLQDGPRTLRQDPVSGLRAALAEPWAHRLTDLDVVLISDFDPPSQAPTTAWKRRRPAVHRYLLPVIPTLPGPDLSRALNRSRRQGWCWAPDWLSRCAARRQAEDFEHRFRPAPPEVGRPRL